MSEEMKSAYLTQQEISELREKLGFDRWLAAQMEAVRSGAPSDAYAIVDGRIIRMRQG